MTEAPKTTWDGLPPGDAALRDGWHWLVPAINPTLPPGAYRWHAPPRPNVVGNWQGVHPLDMLRRGYAYLGPCLTPSEHEWLAAEIVRLRRGWLRVIQQENSCPATGGGCLAKRCGCVEEMEMLANE